MIPEPQIEKNSAIVHDKNHAVNVKKISKYHVIHMVFFSYNGKKKI